MIRYQRFFAFGECELIPCKVIKLSNPVITIETPSVDTEVEMFEKTQLEQSSGTATLIEVPPDKQPSMPNPTKSTPAKQTSKGSVMDGLVNTVNAVKDFSDKHPVLTTVVEVDFGITATVVTGKAIANGVVSKDAICAFLENNINLHKNQATFAEAVAKWMSDLAFLKDV